MGTLGVIAALGVGTAAAASRNVVAFSLDSESRLHRVAARSPRSCRHPAALETAASAPPWALAAGIAAYLFLAALVMAGWFLAPFAVFLGFILLTWIHWGLGDLWWSWQRDPAYFTSRFHRVIFMLWRGALPILLPLVVAPQIYRQVAESICQLFSTTGRDLYWMDAITIRAIIMTCVLGLGLGETLFANGKSATRLLNAVEGWVLFSGFVLLPPLPAVGFYFVFWHGLRHVQRLMKTEHLSFLRFARRSAPATLAALVLLAVLGCALLRQKPPSKFLGVYLALIATLTVPHSAVVTWMDRRARLY